MLIPVYLNPSQTSRNRISRPRWLRRTLRSPLRCRRHEVDPFAAIRDPTRRAWLRAFALCGNKSRACRAVGIDRSTPYTRPWQDDPEFQEGLKVAEKLAADLLESEAQHRAVEGTVVPVGWYEVEPGGYVRE